MIHSRSNLSPAWHGQHASDSKRRVKALRIRCTADRLQHLQFYVCITTYNRPENLLALLHDIQRETDGRCVRVSVFDDASKHPYDNVHDFVRRNQHWMSYVRNSRAYRKEGFWRLWNSMFRAAHQETRPEFYVFLQDDVRLLPGFFTRIERIWDAIDDPRKTALNLLVDRRGCRAHWTPIEPQLIRFGDIEVARLGWLDCIFMAAPSLFNVLQWKIKPIRRDRWRQNPDLSSGVGEQISWRLYETKRSIYSPISSLVTLADCPSVMHPELRRRHPIVPTTLRLSQGVDS
ncbi:MAG: hypothetical protein P9L99_16530 [Candidatus Lernaella stagnicola]|nr:hypothetical protein [Candidatus Lernaella stagnicola]